jgi:hypothetical protein
MLTTPGGSVSTDRSPPKPSLGIRGTARHHTTFERLKKLKGMSEKQFQEYLESGKFPPEDNETTHETKEAEGEARRGDYDQAQDS